MKTAIAILASVWLASTAIAAPRPLPDFGSEDKESKVEREQDLYEEGQDALDDHDWRHAARVFEKVADMKMGHADGALFWLAYSQNKLGQRAEALTTLVALQ